ncbi:MAG TPA: flagellar basal body L-ring protein FlgH [Burkholderiaceae bacterium]
MKTTGVLAAILLAAAASAAAQSLYDPKSFRPLTADSKAFRPGDIVTIQIVENASASANADTDLKRSNSGGAELHFRSPVPIAGANATGSTQFDGSGQTARTGQLLATLSVTVREVLPNGDLLVSGEQLLVINEEQQRIDVEGRVRPQDISDQNTVLSNRVADARITYVGEGDVASRQKPGWLRHILDLFGL